VPSVSRRHRYERSTAHRQRRRDRHRRLPEVRQSLRTRAESAENALDEAEKDLRQKRAQINALKKDRDTERKTYGKREQVMDCFNHWVERTGKTKSKLSADRFDAIKARLNEGYTVEQIKLAIDGAAAYPVRGQCSEVSYGHGSEALGS
jgi:uncharacterized phage protein (TIGR02220 family)